MSALVWRSPSACRGAKIPATERCEQCRHAEWSAGHTAVLNCVHPAWPGHTHPAARCNAWEAKQ